MKRFSLFFVISFLWAGSSCGEKAARTEGTMPAQLTITSSVFQEGGTIPATYTCKGNDISPPLSWSGVPAAAQSLVLVSDDPDAPVGTWVHWVFYDIPPTVEGLPENVEKTKKPPVGGTQGMNDFRKFGYGGPCPPSGTHRYFFKLYALDKMLSLEAGATKAAVLKAMEGHIIAEGVLMGKFSR